MKWTCPVDGIYRVSSKMVKFVPTGKFETVRNPNYRWWKAWFDCEPKMIQREVYEQTETHEGEEMKLMKVGEQVEVPVSKKFIIERIKN